MNLSIKDPEAHRLAKEIAASTGESLTKVVVDTLRQRRERMPMRRPKPTLEEFLAAAKRVSAALDRPIPDHGDFLYDEHGLPK